MKKLNFKKIISLILAISCFTTLIPNVLAQDSEDVTVNYKMDKNSAKVLSSGAIFLNRSQGGAFGKRQPINDSGLWWKGLFLHFSEIDTSEIADLTGDFDKDVLSATLYVYAYNEQNNKNEKLYISEYSKASLPATTATGTDNIAIGNETETSNFNTFYNGFTALDENAYSEALGVETASQPIWVGIDLLQEDASGNRLIDFELDKPLNLLLCSNSPKWTNIVFADDYKPYIEIVYSKESLRINNAKAAVDLLEPYVDGEINNSNATTVRTLLDDAIAKVNLIKDTSKIAEFQTVIDRISSKYNIYEIEGLRETLTISDTFTLDYNITNTFDFSNEKDYYLKFDVSLLKELGENDEIVINPGEDIVIKLKKNGVYLNNELKETSLNGDNEFLVQIKKKSDTSADVVLFLNKESAVSDTIENIEDIDNLSITHNTTNVISAISDVILETCPEGYGSDALVASAAFKECVDTADNSEFFSKYSKAKSQNSILGTSVLQAMLIDIVNDVWEERITDMTTTVKNEKKYSKLEEINALINRIDPSQLQRNMMAIYNAAEESFSVYTPVIVNASIKGIAEVDEEIEVEYIIKDEIGNGDPIANVEWILDGKTTIGTDKNLVIASRWAEKKVVAVVTPKNNKGVLGKSYKTFEIEIKKKKTPGPSGIGSFPIVTEPKENDNNSQKVEIPEKLEVFNDIQNSWAKADIEMLYEKKIINGVDGLSFNPKGRVTRAEFTKMIVMAFNLSDSQGAVMFDDVKNVDWFYDVVNIASGNGLVNGNNGKFNPNAPITRQEATKILIAGMGRKEDMQISFNDNELISPWAVDFIKTAVALKLINGDENNNFRPLDNLSREEAAAIISRSIK